jgi:hypothetical protein
MTAAMIQHALSDDPPVCSGDDALGVLEIAAAVHVSNSEAHRVVSLPLFDDGRSLERIA